MQSENRLLEDLARVAQGAAGAFAGMREELETRLKEHAERLLSRMHLVRREEFDAVMFWDLADFLPEPLVKPLIERIQVAMKPGGILFGLFHTKDAGPDSPFYRYNIASKDTLELQPARAFRLQRIFNNRHVENLFREYSSIKFFLGRDNIREVLVIR